MKDRQYLAIDLKSFYASVECVERGLDPIDTCLVVADESRTQKTICLAVSPALKAYGTGPRPRLFEVFQKIELENAFRGNKNKSYSSAILKENPDYAIDFLIAPPRMSLYIDYSSRIYDIYMRFVASDDILIYSIDEVFIDITEYLVYYKISSHDLAMKIIREVLKETGITATAGIGTNMYLAKVAMDIVAKKMNPDKDGVRVAQLDEMKYRTILWEHFPLTDFWRVGTGIAAKLAYYGIFTMGDLARTSIKNEKLLFKLFGVNAELLIDHAWGREPVTIKLANEYKSGTKSISSGQVLQAPYSAGEARNVIIEMADALSYELLEKGYVTNQIVLTIGYDVESLINPNVKSKYSGKIKTDHYGRKVPYHAHGTTNIERYTSSSNTLIEKVAELYDRIINPILLIRRLTIVANNIIDEKEVKKNSPFLQINLFSDYDKVLRKERREKRILQEERSRQEAVLKLRSKYGKNIVLRGLNFAERTTQKDRNSQIGGHKA